MNRKVLTDGNGGPLIHVEGMGDYVPLEDYNHVVDELESVRKELTACKQAAPTGVLSNEAVKSIALDNGFKLKEQPDGTMELNPYVYDFAAALQARTITDLKFPVMLRKMWSGGEVQAWLNEQSNKSTKGAL